MLPQLLKLAIHAALSPSAFILSGFRSPGLRVDRKSDNSPVTEFDREAEHIIRSVLTSEAAGESWPILGEEHGGDAGSSDFYWIIDPIDGTTPYTRGLPHFGTLVALDDARAQRAVVGVIHLPAFGETYTAACGLGARCNGMPIRVAPYREPRERLISIPSADLFHQAGLAESHAKLCKQGARFLGNADCWMHAMVARGAVDLLVEFNLQRWDIAATQVLIEEAGGQCLIRNSNSAPGKYDILIGSPQAVLETAALVGFSP